MTPLRIAVFALMSTNLSLAADLPRTTFSNNVVVCQPNAGCGHHMFYGLDHKILTTDRFTVMVFLSREGRYTRADVSVTNLTSIPASLSPEDFRVEALNSRSKTFLYVPPSQLEDIPPPIRPIPNAAPDAAVFPANSEMSRLDAAKQRAAQEAIELLAATPHLKAIVIPPSQAISGRVYFERDPLAKRQQVNVVLPIAGTVFKFPYVIEP